MSGFDDLFGSSPSQGPGNPALEESDADQGMRDHYEALAQLRAHRKLTQLLASQEADRASAPFDSPVLTRTDQVSLGVPAAPDLVGNYTRDNPFGSVQSNPPSGNPAIDDSMRGYLAQAMKTPHAWTNADGTTVNINHGNGTLEVRDGGN